MKMFWAAAAAALAFNAHAANELKIGMKVKPYWHPLDNGEHLLMWQPDRDAK